jgi:hypothetical protein
VGVLPWNEFFFLFGTNLHTKDKIPNCLTPQSLYNFCSSELGLVIEGYVFIIHDFAIPQFTITFV